MSKRNQIWVGRTAGTLAGTVFRNPTTPTTESHGEKFAAVVGPFRTVRGAAWMAHPTRGTLNPHCRCVGDAERLAKMYANSGGYDPKTRTWSEPRADERAA
jgi:hypothetical protein